MSNSLFTVLCGDVGLISMLVLWLGICVDLDVERITILLYSPSPSIVPPSVPSFLSLPKLSL